MDGHSMTLTKVIHASPVRVWAVLTDLDRAPEVLRNVSRVERMTDGPYAVGTRWRETRTMMGREGTEEMWVVENDPLQRTVIAAQSGGTDYRTELTLTEEGPDRTMLSYSFSAHTPEPSTTQKVMWKVLGGLGRRATTKAIQQDLQDIARAAEHLGEPRP